MIDEKDFAVLDARYRKIDDCDDIKQDYKDRLDSLSIDIAVIKTKLTFLQWLGGVVGASVVSIAIKYLFGGV